MMKKNDENFCCKILHDAMFEGYVLMQIIRDENGEACDFLLLDANSQFEIIFNVSRKNILGKKVMSLPMEPGWNDICIRLLKQETCKKFECSFESIDKYFWINSYFPNEDQIALLFVEITAQKKAQEALLMHEILFENAHDIILYISMEGQIVNANKRACAEYGYTRKQLISLKISDIRHPSTMDMFEQQMKEADESGIIFECIHVRSDGTSFPVEVSAKSTKMAKETIPLSLRSRIALKYSFLLSPYLNSVTSVSHFSLSFSAVKLRFKIFSATISGVER